MAEENNIYSLSGLWCNIMWRTTNSNVLKEKKHEAQQQKVRLELTAATMCYFHAEASFGHFASITMQCDSEQLPICSSVVLQTLKEAGQAHGAVSGLPEGVRREDFSL